MKLAFGILLISSFSFAMQDTKNMSREMLEQKLQEAQRIIDLQKQTILTQQAALKLVHDLHYGTPLEQVSAKADVQRVRQMNYLNRYAK